jgi:hypothetical protein
MSEDCLPPAARLVVAPSMRVVPRAPGGGGAAPPPPPHHGTDEPQVQRFPGAACGLRGAAVSQKR